jgi:hypothetical protein
MNTLVGHPLRGWLSRKRTVLGTSTENFVRALGGGAVVALVVIGAVNSGDSPSVVLARSGGSGDSATTTDYVQPAVPAISLSATLSSGSAIGSVSPLSSGNQHIPSNPEHHQHRCQHSMHCA